MLTVADGIFTIDGAPGQIGSHDGYVDAEAITYTVVRYPGEMIVAEGLAATEFSEKVPDTRWPHIIIMCMLLPNDKTEPARTVGFAHRRQCF